MIKYYVLDIQNKNSNEKSEGYKMTPAYNLCIGIQKRTKIISTKKYIVVINVVLLHFYIKILLYSYIQAKHYHMATFMKNIKFEKLSTCKK